MAEAVIAWLNENGCPMGDGILGSKAFAAFEIGLDAPKLVNIIVFPETVNFNDVDGRRYSIPYADPDCLDILESVLATGRVRHRET